MRSSRPPTGPKPSSNSAAGRFDVVVTDLKMPKLDGIELLKQIKQGPAADMEVIMMTAYGSIPVAVEAVKLGAFDFLTKPFRNEDLFPLLGPNRAAAASGARPRRGRSSSSSPADVEATVVGRSAAMDRVKRMIEVCVKTDANVLLYGETGVGKDLLAATIHRNSYRRAVPLRQGRLHVVPAATDRKRALRPRTRLVHRRRAATQGPLRSGRRRHALPRRRRRHPDGAAGEAAAGDRGKGLRARRRQHAHQGRRADHRLDQAKPARKDRRGHVPRGPLLPARRAADQHPAAARAIGRRAAAGRTPAEPHRRRATLPDRADAMELLSRHEWPGNVRELYHTLERTYLIGGGNITAEVLAAEIGGPDPNQRLPVGGFQAAIDHAEKQLLQEALRNSNGNKSAAAAALGMKPSTFRDKLAKHGLG